MFRALLALIVLVLIVLFIGCLDQERFTRARVSKGVPTTRGATSAGAPVQRAAGASKGS